MFDYHTLPLKPKKHAKLWTPEDDAYLCEWFAIDPVLLADHLKRPLRNVLSRMRYLGLRKCTHSPRKGERDGKRKGS